jgi:RES domain-containing protein
MGSLHTTVADELAAQLEHPNAASVWSRAVEVFGEEALANDWMNTARDIFDGRSPRELVATEDPAKLRLVLRVLLRIDYGVFS